MCRETHRSDALLDTCADEAVARIAERQGGVVSTAQLRAVGLGRGGVQLRVRNGRLHPLHRGVYMVGHRRIGLLGHLSAAVWACGGPDAAVVSHRAAAAVHDLLPAPSGAVDVTTLRQSRSTSGVRVHRTSTLDPRIDVTHRDGLPVTAVARTIADLAATMAPHRLERACHRAEHLRLLDRTEPHTVRGARRLRAALETLATREPDLTRSDLQERFLSLVAQHHLPRPRTNTRIAGHEADFVWPAHRLIVETDGAATHLTAHAFEDDRKRDADHTLAGYRVVRFTWRQITQEPAAVARTCEPCSRARSGSRSSTARTSASAPPSRTRPRSPGAGRERCASGRRSPARR